MPHFPKPFFRTVPRPVVRPDRRQAGQSRSRPGRTAFRRYHALMANPSPVPPLNQPTTSVAAICDNFLEWVQRNRSPDTYEWYRYRLQRFIDRYPKLQVGDVRPYHVEQWVDSYELSRTSRRNYFRSVKRCLNWAARQGYIETSPIEHLEVPAGERKDVYVSPEEFERLLTFVREDCVRDLLVVTYETGCRPQESLRVEARHVELSHSRWVFPQKESKTKDAPRIVYLSETAVEITRRLMLAHPAGPLFRNSRGVPWTTEATNCAIGRVQERMGAADMNRRGETISDREIASLIPKLAKTRKVQGPRGQEDRVRAADRGQAEAAQEASRPARSPLFAVCAAAFLGHERLEAGSRFAHRGDPDGPQRPEHAGQGLPASLPQSRAHARTGEEGGGLICWRRQKRPAGQSARGAALPLSGRRRLAKCLPYWGRLVRLQAIHIGSHLEKNGETKQEGCPK
jgi:integrase